MPRTNKQNEKIRETSKNKILETTLQLYVVYGYNGTDMDTVADKAGVAKGLLYYYYKNKNKLFRELFNMVMKKITDISNEFFLKTKGMTPVEKLVSYSVDIFGLGISNPDYIRFSMRLPFDAYSVFGPDGWQEGMSASRIHMKNLEKIIGDGMEQDRMNCRDAASGANAYWTVFVSGLFNFTIMIGKTRNMDNTSNLGMLENLMEFGMNGLQINSSEWKEALKKCMEEKQHESV